jgi:ribose transport system permease protein
MRGSGAAKFGSTDRGGEADSQMRRNQKRHDDSLLRQWISRGPITAVVATFIVSLALALATPNFMTRMNLQVVSNSLATGALVAFSQMVVLAAGGLNASVGAIGGLVTISVGGLMQSHGVPPLLAIIAGILIGAACGALNGFLIVRMKLHSFIITLATGSIFTGINLSITSGQPYYQLPDRFNQIGAWNVGGIQVVMFAMLAIAAILALVFARTGIGRQILAMGGNARAAEYAGAPIDRCQIAVHSLSGVLAASAAIILTAEIGAAQPSVGSEWLLPSFAGPIIGGTSLMGGVLSVPGAVLGALLLTLVNNGLVHLRINLYWAQLFSGLIVVGAGAIDHIRVVNSERYDREQRLAILRQSNRLEATAAIRE